MRAWFMAVLIAAFGIAQPASAINSGASAPAQAPSRAQQVNEELRELGEWSAAFQGVISGVVEPMQRLPRMPSQDVSGAERRAWASQARAWAHQAQESFAALLVRAQSLPPPPRNELLTDDMRAALEQARNGLPDIISSCQQMAERYLQLADAFEQRRADAFVRIRASAIDAALLTLNLFHDINTAQAAAIESTHPQSSLLLSYARSYEAMGAYLRFKRDIMLQREHDRLAIASVIQTAAEQMRSLSVTGRGATRVLQQRIADPAAFGPDPEAQALRRRLQSMLATYDGSFDRDAAIAAELAAMADLFRDSRAFGEVEPEIDRHMDVASELDAERLDDGRRRQALLSGR